MSRHRHHPRHRSTHDAAPNLTPVVNIAMVILVVFMLTASFIEPQLYMRSDVALLEQGGTSNFDPDWVPPTPLAILVNMDPQVPSAFTATVGGDQTDSAVALQNLLHSKREALQATGTAVDDIQVEITPQSQVIWQHLITVYEAAQRAGFTSITFTPAR